MIWCYRQPTLADVLSDPVTRAVMDADGVNPRELEMMLIEMARELRVMRRTGRGTAGMSLATSWRSPLRS